ncbi:hypothetical protein CF327_g6854 [Tilletia walkeri]|nr:hypothetical protein CF327_g6854 [Tilletia walkeri]
MLERGNCLSPSTSTSSVAGPEHLVVPALCQPSLLADLPNHDTISTLLAKHIPPHIRHARDTTRARVAVAMGHPKTDDIPSELCASSFSSSADGRPTAAIHSFYSPILCSRPPSLWTSAPPTPSNTSA